MVKLRHIGAFGQSLSLGNNAGEPPITTTPEAAQNVFRLLPGGVMEPLVAILTPGGAQQPGISMAYRIAEAYPDDLILYSMHGRGGRTIDELSKGGDTAVYSSILNRVTEARAIADDYGYDYEFSFMAAWQGENDERETPPTSWLNSLVKLKSDLKTDLGLDIPFVFGQMSKGTSYHPTAVIGIAQLKGHIEGILTLSGAEYQYPYRDANTNLHHTQLGYYWAGEKLAQTWLTGQRSDGWTPLSPDIVNIVETPTHIDVPYHVPVPPLAWDNSFTTPDATRGYRLKNTSASIASVEILPDGVTVRISLTSPIVETGATLEYASYRIWQGNLRDSDPYRSKLDQNALPSEYGRPLPNFAVQHRIPLTPTSEGSTDVLKVVNAYLLHPYRGLIRIG